MPCNHHRRQSRGVRALTGALLALSVAVAGCAAVLGVKDTSFKDKTSSLEDQAAFYAALLPGIEPASGAQPALGRAALLSPTYTAALAAVARDPGRAEEDQEYAARGMIHECQSLADVLRKRRLFAEVSLQEAESPPDLAPKLSDRYQAVIFLDPLKKEWFFLPMNGGAADMLPLGMFLAQSHDDVRGWLARIEDFRGRPPLTKAPSVELAPPPSLEPPRPPAAARKPASRDLQPGPFGLMWRANAADLRRLKVKLGPPRKDGDLVEYAAEKAPEFPERTGQLLLGFHNTYGLQMIVWRSAVISGDPYGFLGREQFFGLQNTLEEKYGPATATEKNLSENLSRARDQFYSCLSQVGCGKWAVAWRLPELFVRLELLPKQEAEGFIALTYQGPDWEKIMAERKRQQQPKMENPL